ncbi:hypothetical protein AAH678_29860 [Sodalis endosymbiont of Spalangia cameroni]|uniref:hypothetical protein n=1 Tax=Sodalis praecaptivus TaxID=1239307 RepID=UPI0031F92317
MTARDPNTLSTLRQLFDINTFQYAVHYSPVPFICFNNEQNVLYKNNAYVNFERKTLGRTCYLLDDVVDLFDLNAKIALFRQGFFSDSGADYITIELCAIHDFSYKVIAQKVVNAHGESFFWLRFVSLSVLDITHDVVFDIRKNVLPDKQLSRFALFCAGLSISEIARIENSSYHSIKNQIQIVKRKYGIMSMDVFVRQSLNNGVLLRLIRKAMLYIC